MHTRGPVPRALIALGLSCGVAVALASGIVLNGYPLVLVVLAGVLAASVAYVLAHEVGDAGPTRSLDAAWKAAVGTVSSILVVGGLVVLTDGLVAAVVTAGAVVTGGAVWLLRAWRARHARRAAPHPAAALGGEPAPTLEGAWLGSQPPVSLLSTTALGREWLWTTAALGRPLEAAVQQAVVRRRQENLDELERRDPAGLARWLADGAAADPARFVRRDPTAGTDAA